MRLLRPCLAGILSVTLLVGLGVVAEAEDPKPVAVTGAVVTQVLDDSEEEWWTEPTAVGHARGFKVYETWEWS